MNRPIHNNAFETSSKLPKDPTSKPMPSLTELFNDLNDDHPTPFKLICESWKSCGDQSTPNAFKLPSPKKNNNWGKPIKNSTASMFPIELQHQKNPEQNPINIKVETKNECEKKSSAQPIVSPPDYHNGNVFGLNSIEGKPYLQSELLSYNSLVLIQDSPIVEKKNLVHEHSMRKLLMKQSTLQNNGTILLKSSFKKSETLPNSSKNSQVLSNQPNAVRNCNTTFNNQANSLTSPESELESQPKSNQLVNQAEQDNGLNGGHVKTPILLSQVSEDSKLSNSNSVASSIQKKEEQDDKKDDVKE